jgi:hypothetical protein
MLPQQSQDPLDPGPLQVTRATYQQVDGKVQIVTSGYGSFVRGGEFTTDLKTLLAHVEVLADVYYPTNLPGGPYPLVVFMHGNHRFSYSSDGENKPIPSYLGYDYISKTLASDGYIVVSISANYLTFFDGNSADANVARAQLIQHHLDLWYRFDTKSSGPFGSLFVGKVNLNDIGLMGHSRGGEGVATEVKYNAGGVSVKDPQDPSKIIHLKPEHRYGIKAVMLLAPTDLLHEKVKDVALGVILPYLDGDVTDLGGVQYFDRTFLAKGDTSPEEMFLVMGANHNFFNTVWTPGNVGGFPANDDWLGAPTEPGIGRLTAAQQQAVGNAYITAFFRTYLGGETAFVPMLDGAALPPKSTDVATGQPADIHTTYLAPDTPSTRLDVDRMDKNTSSLQRNTLGGLVITINVKSTSIPWERKSVLGSDNPIREPDYSSGPDDSRLGELELNWNKPGAFLENLLPSKYSNLSHYAALEFRVGVNFKSELNSSEETKTGGQDFSVTLQDVKGQSASVKVSDWSTALEYPPGTVDPLPRLLLNGVRIPLSAFLTANKNLNLSQIRSISFNFNQRPTGSLVFSDISLDDPGARRRYVEVTRQMPIGRPRRTDGALLVGSVGLGVGL